jgi:hypothetical protein
MMEVLGSFETSALTIATRRNIPDEILHSRRRENLKSYKRNRNLGNERFELEIYL